MPVLQQCWCVDRLLCQVLSNVVSFPVRHRTWHSGPILRHLSVRTSSFAYFAMETRILFAVILWFKLITRLELNYDLLQMHRLVHTHTRLTALCPGLPRWAGTRKAKPILILLKQETASGSSISWAVCKSASRSRQITMLPPQHSVFYRPDAVPATQPTASKHWRHNHLVHWWAQIAHYICYLNFFK